MITSDEITALLNMPNLKHKWNYMTETDTLTGNGFSINLCDCSLSELRNWIPIIDRFDTVRYKQYCRDHPL